MSEFNNNTNTNTPTVSTTQIDTVETFRVKCSELFTVQKTAPTCRRWDTAFVGTTEVAINDPYNFSYTFASVNEAKLLRLYHISDKVAVTVTGGNNGTVTKEGENEVCRGEDFTFSYTPASGYKVDYLRINGVTVSFSESGGSHTIDNIQVAQNIEVGFVPNEVSIIVNVAGNGGSANNVGTNQVVIGNNFSVTASPTTGGVIALISDTVSGNINVASPASAYTYQLTNVQQGRTISIQFITIRQSLGYLAYPGNGVIQPIAFRNNGLEIWKAVRSGDGGNQHDAGFGLDNAVTRIRFWNGSALNSLTLRTDFSTAQTDFRGNMGFDDNNSRHKIRIDRTNGGYFETTGNVTDDNGTPNDSRTCRVWLSDVQNGNLVFSVITSMQDGNTANPPTSSASISMTINGTSKTISQTLTSNVKTITHNILTPGTYTVRVQMQITGETDTYYCEGQYIIS